MQKSYKRDLEDRNKELEKIAKEHNELELLIDRMQEYCVEEKMQFCGIKKILIEGQNHYVGFALMSENVDKKKNTYSYCLFGYICRHDGTLDEVYSASLTQHIDGEIPEGLSTRLELVKQNVEIEQYKRHGIGTCAMSTVKDLAKQLHCGKITGRRKPVKDTAEEEKNLWNFYYKNGFSQPDGVRDISFDITKYRSDTGKMV